MSTSLDLSKLSLMDALDLAILVEEEVLERTPALAAFLDYVWETFPVQRLEAEVFSWNPASARVLEKNGFILEGTRRKAILKDGELIDEGFYALLRDDKP